MKLYHIKYHNSEYGLGVAAIIANNPNEAELILKKYGVLNANPYSYKVIQIKEVGEGYDSNVPDLLSECAIDPTVFIGPKGDKGDKGADGNVDFNTLTEELLSQLTLPALNLVKLWKQQGELTGPKGVLGDRGNKGDKGDSLTFDLLTPSLKLALKGEKGDTGEKGDDGVTFIPSVDSNGNISWTNNKNKPNPNTINIKGPSGISPTVVSTKVGKTTTIEITDVLGKHTTTIKDGEKGDTGPQGPQGELGILGIQGKLGIQGITGSKGDSVKYRGDWNSSLLYNELDIVSENGSSYICKLLCVNIDVSDTQYWGLIAKKGLDITKEDAISFSNLIFITNQELFDLFINNVNNRQYPSNTIVVLNEGTFKIKNEVSNSLPLTIIGSNSIIEGPYFIYSRENADSEYNNITHYRCLLDALHNTDYTIGVISDSNKLLLINDIVDDTYKVNLTEYPYLDSRKQIASASTESQSSKIYYIPAPNNDDISNKIKNCIDTGNSKLFGWLKAAWSVEVFLVLSYETITVAPFADKVSYNKLYFKVELKEKMQSGENPNKFFDATLNPTTDKLPNTYNLYVIYNVDGNGVYYDNLYIYIPREYLYIKVIKNLYNENNTEGYCIRSTAPIKLSGIHFKNFLNVIKVFLNNNYASTNSVISNCTFENIFEHSIYMDCATSIIDIDFDLYPLKILKCTFKNCLLFSGSAIKMQGLSIKNLNDARYRLIIDDCEILLYLDTVYPWNNGAYNIVLRGATLVKHTIIHASSCRAIFVLLGNIRVTDCTIHGTSENFKYKYRNLGDDLGGIYCGTLGTVISSGYGTQGYGSAMAEERYKLYSTAELDNNLIYNIVSSSDKNARGVMIDDGRCNVYVHDNIVLNTDTYNIDSRNVDGASYVGGVDTYSCARNRIENNIINNGYKLLYGKGIDTDARKEELVPISKNNLLLGNISNVINSDILTSDVLILNDNYTIVNNTIFINNALYKTLPKTFKDKVHTRINTNNTSNNNTLSKLISSYGTYDILHRYTFPRMPVGGLLKILFIGMTNNQIGYSFVLNNRGYDKHYVCDFISANTSYGYYSNELLELVYIDTKDSLEPVKVYVLSHLPAKRKNIYSGLLQVEYYGDPNTYNLNNIVLDKVSYDAGVGEISLTDYEKDLLTKWDPAHLYTGFATHGQIALNYSDDLYDDTLKNSPTRNYMDIIYKYGQRFQLISDCSLMYKDSGGTTRYGRKGKILSNGVHLAEGTTSERPYLGNTSVEKGFLYFDSDLGLVVYWNGSKWSDAVES